MFVFYALAKVPLSLVGTLMDSAYIDDQRRKKNIENTHNILLSYTV